MLKQKSNPCVHESDNWKNMKGH